MVTLILTLTMYALLFLMIRPAAYFCPWTGLLRFIPKDIEEKARLHRCCRQSAGLWKVPQIKKEL